MKILFYIQTCKKYSYRREAIENTFLKRIQHPNEYIFLSNETILEKNIISFNVGVDSYELSSLKHLLMLKYLFINKNNFDYYVYTDDDCYIFVNRILNFINEIDKQNYNNSICVCRIGEYNGPGVGNNANVPIKYPGGGAGFIYNNKTLMQVCNYLNNENNPPMCNFGDVSYGWWFKNSGGVELIHTELLRPFPPEKEGHTELQIYKHLTYHYLQPNDFYNLERYN